jgi:predicted DNA-binding ribbon-helix-helix protein
MQSAVIKRSIVISGHKTSISLEDDFWEALKQIGRDNKKPVSGLVADIDVRRLHANLSSAIRIFVLHHYRTKVLQTLANGVDGQAEQRRSKRGGQPSLWNGRAGEYSGR